MMLYSVLDSIIKLSPSALDITAGIATLTLEFFRKVYPVSFMVGTVKSFSLVALLIWHFCQHFQVDDVVVCDSWYYLYT